MKKKIKKPTDARSEAKAQLDHLRLLVSAFNRARLTIESKDSEHAQTRLEEAERDIHESALSVQVRHGWYDPCEPDSQGTAVDFSILIRVVNPACRIVGILDRDTPDHARLEYQDWGTPWTDYRLTAEEEYIVLTYARCFYYGD